MKVRFITSKIFVGKRCGGFGELVYVDFCLRTDLDDTFVVVRVWDI